MTTIKDTYISEEDIDDIEKNTAHLFKFKTGDFIYSWDYDLNKPICSKIINICYGVLNYYELSENVSIHYSKAFASHLECLNDYNKRIAQQEINQSSKILNSKYALPMLHGQRSIWGEF